MFKQIIKPKKKEDLIIQLPEEFLEKEIEVDAYEINAGNGDQGSSREDRVKEAFELFDKMKVSMKNFKFNRDEANER